MKSLLVKDLAVPLAEYATVSVQATLYDAIMALEEVHALDQSHYRHRAILVFDDKNRVIGKLGQFDILIALESKYQQLGDLERLACIGLSSAFIKSVFNQYSFWSKPLSEICIAAAQLKVNDIMHRLAEDEYIEESAPLDEAIHQLIMGRYQSLIVTRGQEIVGILKLSDIFRDVCVMVQSHKE